MNPLNQLGKDHIHRMLNMTLTQTYDDLLKELAIPCGGEMVFRFCDKGHNHSYLPFYQKYFEPYRSSAAILEIGVMTGGSLLLWQRWFDKVETVGIDLRNGYNEIFPWQTEIVCTNHWSTDTTNAASVPALNQYNFVIDDGLHTLDGQWQTFQNYWQFVKSDGTYFIEDIETEHNQQELQFRIQAWLGDAVQIEHYRGHTREDDQILAITRK
jgi:hypothetical protein